MGYPPVYCVLQKIVMAVSDVNQDIITAAKVQQ